MTDKHNSLPWAIWLLIRLHNCTLVLRQGYRECMKNLVWGRDYLVSCLARACLPARWTKSNFLGLYSQKVASQWDCEIGYYYVHLPSQPWNQVISTWVSVPFFERVCYKMFQMLLGYTVTKPWDQPKPNKSDLVHPTVSPHERVQSGNKTGDYCCTGTCNSSLQGVLKVEHTHTFTVPQS